MSTPPPSLRPPPPATHPPTHPTDLLRPRPLFYVYTTLYLLLAGLSGAEVLASPFAPTWLRQLYPPRPSPTSRKLLDSMDDSDEDSESGSEDEGEGGGREEKEGAAPDAVGVAVVEVLPAGPVKERGRDGNVFASRIAAHAECTKKLWRARYLALRDVRMYICIVYMYTLYEYITGIARGGISHTQRNFISLPLPVLRYSSFLAAYRTVYGGATPGGARLLHIYFSFFFVLLCV